MKKYTLLAAIVTLSACNTYHSGRTGLVFNDTIKINTEANIKVDTASKISGSAQCNSILWIFNPTPERQAYISEFQTNKGNFATDACTAGAMYDALNKSNADIVIAPQYTTVQQGLFCFGTKCLAGTTKVLVSGYAGKITSFTNK